VLELVEGRTRGRRLSIDHAAWRASDKEETAMKWDFEMVAGPFNPRLTEGPAWDGTALLFTHIPTSRILRYDPVTGQCTVFREHTNHTNGLAFDAEGRLYGCCSGGRSIVRFESDGSTTTIVDH
jgi:gluconolactonase